MTLLTPSNFMILCHQKSSVTQLPHMQLFENSGDLLDQEW